MMCKKVSPSLLLRKYINSNVEIYIFAKIVYKLRLIILLFRMLSLSNCPHCCYFDDCQRLSVSRSGYFSMKAAIFALGLPNFPGGPVVPSELSFLSICV